MAKGFKHGAGASAGGVDIGLKVVGGLARPANPSEELVWANTDTEITGYVLSATAPENPAAGMLWIKISDSSNIKVGTPLGKDYITIMLNSVSQYVGGAWVNVEAKSFQNGVWVDWIPSGSLYLDGLQVVKWVDFPGWGWTNKPATFNEKTVTVDTKTTNNDDWSCGITTSKKVDISNYTKLLVELDGSAIAYTGSNFTVCISSRQAEDYDATQAIAKKIYTSNVSGTVELPFNASGTYYIVIIAQRRAKATIKRIYLE